MRAYAKAHRAKTGIFRVAASAALLSVMLGACSSVPDVVNPVKWYEQTTDFFSGDGQAADTGAPASDTGNQGLAADPDAPAPAPAPSTQVSQASGGLSADQSSGNYASDPIDRQGAPRDVLTAQDTARVEQPPAPAPQPVAPVMAAPMPAPVTAPAPAPITPAPVTAAPPAAPEMAFKAPAPISPPPAPAFAMPTQPANSQQPFGNDEFETVVIGGNGMETMAAPQPMQTLPGAPTSAPSASGALFPQPGATTQAQAGPVNVGSMTRVATIHFANNSSNLDTRDRSILGAVVQLQKERGGRVVVVGHASSRTRDMDYIRHQMVNFEISMHRAATIGNALKGLGLTDEQLEVQAAADSQPLFLEVMPSGEAGNRRVEIYLAP
ncbi:OmpA family protein [Pseudomonadota bacterium]